jgi:oligosaccharide amylase
VRPVPTMIASLVGNNRLLVTANEEGEWSALFYPFPGQFQHLLQSRLGIYDVERRQFAWTRSRTDPLGVPRIEMEGATARWEWRGPQIELTVTDHIHPNHDLLVRVVRLRSGQPRPVRLFSYHSLRIAQSMYQDTAFVDWSLHSLVHFKRGFYFEFFSDPPFTRAACGEHSLKGLQGTYVDAEDGLLEGSLVAHGSPDSALQWDLEATPGAGTVLRFFVAAGTTLSDTGRLRELVRHGGPPRFVRESSTFWNGWIRRRMPDAPEGLSQHAIAVYRHSVLVLRHLTAQNGAIIASPDTSPLEGVGDTYNYCWWRDGGYVAKAMDEAGLYENAQRFLEFAQRCQNADGSFFHRFFPDGERGSTWHLPPFLQVDQTATVVAAAWHHFKRGNDLDVLVHLWPMVKGAANFLTTFRDPQTGLPAASYDLWEERMGIHTYSTAAVIHALERAARIAEELGKDPRPWRQAAEEIHAAALRHLWEIDQGRFVRSVSPRDDRIDASLLLALKLGLIPWSDERARSVVDQIEARLWSPVHGGLARYEGDRYFGLENPWIICTLWLAEARLRLGDRERCRQLIEWVADRATSAFLLPEQIDSVTGEPASAVPLAWSHSTYIDVIHKFAEPGSGPVTLDD